MRVPCTTCALQTPRAGPSQPPDRRQYIARVHYLTTTTTTTTTFITIAMTSMNSQDSFWGNANGPASFDIDLDVACELRLSGRSDAGDVG